MKKIKTNKVILSERTKPPTLKENKYPFTPISSSVIKIKKPYSNFFKERARVIKNIAKNITLLSKGKTYPKNDKKYIPKNKAVSLSICFMSRIFCTIF